MVAKTDIGKERDKNQDAFTFCKDVSAHDWDHRGETELGSEGALVVVVDGMGGTNAGEVASSLAIESLQNTFNTSNLSAVIASEEKIIAFLNDLVTTADRHLNEHMVSHPETMGMGTTLVLCWILKDKAYIAWCGDSRCYVFNPHSGLKPLTKDHSYVQELIDKGELTEEEALTHPDSNLITRGLGDLDSPAKADITIHPIKSGDMFLLCSDGLCGYCTNKTIEDKVRSHYHDIDECCEKLMELALHDGGFDNICVALASVYNDADDQPHKSSLKQFFQNLFASKRV